MDKKDEKPTSSTVWTKYWKHRDFRLIDNVPKDLFDAAPQGNTLRDWNRSIAAGNELCDIYINGRQLCDHRCEIVERDGKQVKTFKEFSSQQEFETFLKDELLNNYPKDNQDQMVAMIINLCYQSGLMHATSSAITTMVAENTKGQKVFGRVDSKIDLRCNEDGLNISERNTYREWWEHSTPHRCADDKHFYLQTETQYLMTPDKVELKDLIVDCPSRNWAKIIDQRPEKEQIARFSVLRELIASIIQMLCKKAVFEEDVPPESKTLHQGRHQ